MNIAGKRLCVTKPPHGIIMNSHHECTDAGTGKIVTTLKWIKPWYLAFMTLTQHEVFDCIETSDRSSTFREAFWEGFGVFEFSTFWRKNVDFLYFFDFQHAIFGMIKLGMNKKSRNFPKLLRLVLFVVPSIRSTLNNKHSTVGQS